MESALVPPCTLAAVRRRSEALAAIWRTLA